MLFAAPLGVASSPARAVLRIQYALRHAAAMTGDPHLHVEPDGRFGPITRAATNRALAYYASTAPSQLRTGQLSPRQIAQHAPVITAAIEELAPL